MLASQLRPQRASLFVCAYALAAVAVFAQTSVTTQHNDIGRTGQNLTETILTPSNVNSTTFGKLFTLSVDGQVYAQPLYLPSVTIGGAVHRVVFVATEHDSVYAFDASTGAQLWKASLLDSAHGAASGATTDPQSDTGCADISALNGSKEYGITGTPVIDPTAGTLYVVSKTLEGSPSYPVQRLHALDVTTGNERLSPVTIQASVSGTGTGNSAGTLRFDAKWENQRPGLLLLNGNVYLGFGSHCDDNPWHGWLLGYNSTTLAQTSVFVATPNGDASGIWMGGAGISADVENSVGRLFIATGNGTYDAKSPYGTNTMDYGDDVIRLTQAANGGLTVADEFTPDNQATFNSDDTDVGSGGVLLLPDQSGSNPHVLVQLGKSGSMYVLNRDNMGGYNTSTNSILQTISVPGGLWGIPAYWNGNLYVWPSSGKLNQFSVTNGVISTSPINVSSQSQSTWYGSTPSISANGTSNGIVWSIDWSQTPGVLYAHNATNVSQLLYTSNQKSTRDSVGTPVKFVVPTIADGNVFVGGDNLVDVYGLLPAPTPDFSLSIFPAALTIQPGSSVSAQITLSPINSFSGTPSFSLTGLPAGVNASVSGGVLNTYTITLSAASTVATTSTPATVAITGTAGNLTHSLSLAVTLSTAPPSTQINASSLYNVYGIFNAGTAPTNGGFDSEGYAYSASQLGSYLFAENAAFTFGAAGVADALSNTTIPLPGALFSTLDLLGAGVNGNQANQSFVVTYTDGTTNKFTQSLSDWCSAQSYSGEITALSMTARVIPSGGSDGCAPKLYGYSFALNNTKTLKSLTLPANRNVVILAATLAGAAAPGFTLSAAQTAISLAQGGAATDTITQTSFGGFTGVASLSASGLPTGLAVTFASGSSAGTSVVSFSATGSTTTGTYPIVITGTAGSVTASVTVNVTVTTPASFSLLASPASVNLTLGGSTTTTITVTPANGFSGSVTLAASGLPNGVSASFGTNPTSGTSVLTLSANTTTAIGTNTITISGTSGSLTTSTAISLTTVNASSSVQVSLANAFNVSYGISTDGKTFGSRAGLDGQGYAYSETLLGSSVTSGGLKFNLGAANGNNAVYGSTISLPSGSHASIALLAAGVNGNQASQPFVVTYADGTTSSFTQSLSDWFTPQSYSGETKAVAFSYRNSYNGTKDNRTFYLYSYKFTLNSAKTVKSIKLPGNRNVVVLAVTLN